MLNHEILNILKIMQEKNAQIFSNPKQTIAMLKDLTENNSEYNAVIRWLGISLSDFNAFSKLENDFKNKQDFARYSLVDGLVREGASEEIAREVIGYWAALAGFELESEDNSIFTIIFNHDTNRFFAREEDSGQEYSISELEKLANKNDPSAQCAMGDYYNTEHNHADFKIAFEWYEKSAKRGNARAQWNIGNFYIVGHGVVEQDFEKSLYWLEKSANQGYVDAMLHLGQVLLMTDNYEKAVYWLEMADKVGHSEAKTLLEQAKMLRRHCNRK